MRRWPEAMAAWNPPEGWRRVSCVDLHTEGEPLRVIVSGFPRPEGDTVLERRAWAREHQDDLRRALMWEPRGHADMYGCLVMPPATPEADFSVLFMHNDGFSTMCGHGIIGVVTAMAALGLVDPADPGLEIGIDTPAGLVRARPHRAGEGTTEVSFRNVPSFAAALDARVDVPDVGVVRYDLGYGGAFYAYVDAADVDLALVPAEAGRLIDLGRRIKRAVQEQAPPRHPDDADLGFVYGTIFVGAPHDPAHHSRNVCVFADGEIDRSPTGTGVSGRLAIHHARGDIARDETLAIESILGTVFSGRVVDEAVVGSHAAIVPEVRGRAWITGRHEFLIDPADPLRHGFLLR